MFKQCKNALKLKLDEIYITQLCMLKEAYMYDIKYAIKFVFAEVVITTLKQR